nr:pre-peptidase C-terminal domain-containing protein [Acanthopleuribacter pedis]
MVHGEEYAGYPGPLPKFFYALGYDVNHPSIDWELIQRVDREAPNWFGICNGWAVAAINYDEPEQVTINGMKLNVGDLKAMLTAIHKDNAAFFLSGRGEEGVTATVFHQIITDSVAKGEPVIFDVDISSEIWNYPTAGVTIETEVDGAWTNVRAVVHFANLTPLNDTRGIELFNNIPVTYRYDTASLNNFEYTGTSIDDHPNRAWVPFKSYLVDRWLVRANHHFTKELYDELLSSSGVGVKEDLFEPNESAAQAHHIRQEFIYASLLTEDTDYYRFSLQQGQPLEVEIDVYEGTAFDLTLISPGGETLVAATGTTNQLIDITAPEAGDYLLHIFPNAERHRESYYRVAFPEDAGSLWLNPHQQTDTTLQVQALHTRDTAASVGSQDVSGYGSLLLENKPGFVRATDRTVWAESWRVGETMYKKKYHRDHVLRARYVVPHLTFRNGWKTRIEVLAEKPGVPVFLQTYDNSGLELRRTEIPLNDQGWFEGYLDQIPAVGLTGAAYFEVETEQDNRLKGTVCFENVRGNYVMIDLQPTPSIGEFIVFDLKTTGTGGTGLAVVNTAPVENQVLYELQDRSGNTLDSGGMYLQPGEKLLDTIAGITDAAIENDYRFYMHTQYPVEGVVIQYQMEPYVMYGHRLMRRDVDNLKETFITLPQDRTLSTLVFANFNDTQIQPLFEGYDAQGNLQGRFNINLQRQLQPNEVRFFDLATLFQNGVGIGDLDAITHLRVRSSAPFMALELLGVPGSSTFMGVPLVTIYDNP